MDNKNQDPYSYGASSYQDPSESEFKWSSASERNSSRKLSWYLGLLLIVSIICTGFYLLTHDIVTIAIVILSFGLISYYGIKKPRKISYLIQGENLYINNRKYDLNNYKYFIVHDRSSGGSVSLIPNKRLAPSISVNFSDKDSNELINKLGSFMPIEHQENDIFDSILRFIGF